MTLRGDFGLCANHGELLPRYAPDFGAYLDLIAASRLRFVFQSEPNDGTHGRRVI
jgi:hypothetical protein